MLEIIGVLVLIGVLAMEIIEIREKCEQSHTTLGETIQLDHRVRLDARPVNPAGPIFQADQFIEAQAPEYSSEAAISFCAVLRR